MGRGTWDIAIKSGGSWVSDGTIYRPNSGYNLQTQSTQTKTRLANGDNVYVTPSTKYVDAPITLIWYWDDGTTKTKLETYLHNQTDIRITDDLGNIYYGRFISVVANRMVGQSDELYDITAIFERMDNIA